MSQQKALTIIIALILLTLGFASGCAHDRCSNLPQRPLASDAESKTPSQGPNPSPGSASAVNPNSTPSIPRDVVHVFKATGEKQCQPGTGLPLDQVQTSLTNRKVTVYDSHTQQDGLIHMSLCGSPSGTIHVFSIPKKDVKKAQRLGFKVLSNVR